MLGIPSRCHIRSNIQWARESERQRERVIQERWPQVYWPRLSARLWRVPGETCHPQCLSSMRQEKSFPASAVWDAGGGRQLQALPVCVGGTLEWISGYVICCWAANYTLCNFYPPSQTWGKWWCVLCNYKRGMNIRDANARCNLLMNGNTLPMSSL